MTAFPITSAAKVRTVSHAKPIRLDTDVVARKNGLKSKVRNYFTSKGFNSADIGRAIFFHELLGLLMLAITWSACYFLEPSSHPVLAKPLAKVADALPRSFMTGLKSNELINSRLGSSYLESSCLRKVIRPLTLPGKMYLTFLLINNLGESRIKDTEKLCPGYKLVNENIYINNDSWKIIEDNNISRDSKYVLNKRTS